MQQKKETEENLQLTLLDGSCPDARLLETGKYKQTVSSSDFDEKKLVDLQNESRPYEDI